MADYLPNFKKVNPEGKTEANPLDIRNRLRSKVLWLTILSFTLFILKTYFKIEVVKGDELINGILTIFTLLGIFNNPSFKNKI